MFQASECSQIAALERACWGKGKRRREREIEGDREPSSKRKEGRRGGRE